LNGCKVMMSQNNNSSTCLMAIYQDILCKPVPERMSPFGILLEQGSGGSIS